MVFRCARGDRSSRQLITFSPERRSRRTTHPPVSTRGKERTNVERSPRDAGHAAGGVLGRQARDGVAMTARWPGPIAESASNTIDPDAAVLRAANGKLATIIKRLLAKRAQRRREQTEFKAWLVITSKPLW
jgi:hypothetical protein